MLSIWSSSAVGRSAGRAVAGAPTWLSPAAPTAAAPRLRWPRSNRPCSPPRGRHSRAAAMAGHFRATLHEVLNPHEHVGWVARLVETVLVAAITASVVAAVWDT